MTLRSTKRFLINCGVGLYFCCKGIIGFKSAVKSLFSGMATIAKSFSL